MVILYINSWNSKCGACGQDCDPYEEQHDTTLGYKPVSKEGCHAIYTHVSTNYAGLNPSDMRPDLIWLDPMENIKL